MSGSSGRGLALFDHLPHGLSLVLFAQVRRPLCDVRLLLWLGHARELAAQRALPPRQLPLNLRRCLPNS